jgi:voltage-gated sodium channel
VRGVPRPDRGRTKRKQTLNLLFERCQAFVNHRDFQRAVLALIVANAILMGIETSTAVMQRNGRFLLVLNAVIQAAFVLEIGIRLLAHGRRPLGFFGDGWNVFDFAVVGLSLLPASGAFANVARLARVLRAARLVSRLPDLRLIVGTMLRSINSMGHVLLLLGLLMYVYGVLGVHLFAEVDPRHWGSLPRAAGTLFQILTLEGWVELLAASREGHPAAWLFYGSFIMITVFVVINLFIAIVINNLERTRNEEVPVRRDEAAVRIATLRRELDALERTIAG